MATKRTNPNIENNAVEEDRVFYLAKRLKSQYRWLDSISSGVIGIDQDYNILYLNRALMNFLGINEGRKPGDFVGKKCYEVFHTTKCHTDSCPSRRTLQTGESMEGILEVVRVDGKSIAIKAMTISYQLEDGGIGSMVTIIPLAEKKKHESQAQEAIEIAEFIERLNIGDHACLIYKTKEEQFLAAITFIKIGLGRGEKCLYVADDNTIKDVMGAMKAHEIDVERGIASGQLVVADKRESYLKRGVFDPEWMVQFLKTQIELAKQQGFKALRGTGEMTWVLGGDPGTERLMEYEAKLNYFIPKHDGVFLCQYNINRFSPDTIIDVIKTHPLVINKNYLCKNLYYSPPDEFLKTGKSSDEVERLLGSIMEKQKEEEALINAMKKYQDRLDRLYLD